ncbi:uncharacterized protein LOC133525261 isoform X2 [Cydia pomonella]|uniref:uncharacterized protein LOC133525261 isoform X2 n=1 Tax=Cydia pomonella TaxID=82600 RepID=UPI002ADDF015|nr:uncharacterized protein LOC133525261 isoform X2 [Cydia pomonella]
MTPHKATFIKKQVAVSEVVDAIIRPERLIVQFAVASVPHVTEEDIKKYVESTVDVFPAYFLGRIYPQPVDYVKVIKDLNKVDQNKLTSTVLVQKMNLKPCKKKFMAKSPQTEGTESELLPAAVEAEDDPALAELVASYRQLSQKSPMTPTASAPAPRSKNPFNIAELPVKRPKLVDLMPSPSLPPTPPPRPPPPPSTQATLAKYFKIPGPSAAQMPVPAPAQMPGPSAI